MKIEVNKLLNILEKKTNKGISRLEELKMYTEEFQSTLSAVLNNLEAINMINKFDVDCPDCKHEMEIESEKPVVPVQAQPSQEPPIRYSGAVGKKYVPFKGEK
jgi:hypothetical protein